MFTKPCQNSRKKLSHIAVPEMRTNLDDFYM